MAIRIIGYKEALEKLRAGEEIHWTGGIDPCSFFNLNEIVRYDTFAKLWKDGFITDFGSQKLHGTVKYKE